MNSISRSILLTVLVSDGALTKGEKMALHGVLDGGVSAGGSCSALGHPPLNKEPQIPAPCSGLSGPTAVTDAPGASVLFTQREAAKMLGVSRVTVWRLVRERVLHRVELMPGMWRYRREDVMRLAGSGWSPRQVNVVSSARVRHAKAKSSRGRRP